MILASLLIVLAFFAVTALAASLVGKLIARCIDDAVPTDSLDVHSTWQGNGA